MSRVSPAQMKKLLDLLSADGVLVDGRVMYTNTNKQNFWKRIAVQLNAVEGGVYKNTWKWCKMWADWKNKTKKKANILLNRKSYNTLEHNNTPSLTMLEIRLLKMINYPIEDKEDALKLEMVTIFDRNGPESDSTDQNVVNNEEVPEPTDQFQVDFLNEDYGNGDMNSKDKTTSEEDEEEDKTPDCYERLHTAMTRKLCDVDDILQKDKLEAQEQEESSDYDQKIDLRVSEKSFKKKKVSLEEYKVRTTLKIEKERVQQKSEELRLRALELKLKGEELRLKEIEMNKITYLTSIEEEKLKCFRDISSSLKELSDRTRSNTLRFHNPL